MTYESRETTGAADAAQILRGFRERVQRLEESPRGGSGQVQLFRPVTETVVTTDGVTVTEGTDSGFVFGTSEWGFDEFGDTL